MNVHQKHDHETGPPVKLSTAASRAKILEIANMFRFTRNDKFLHQLKELYQAGDPTAEEELRTLPEMFEFFLELDNNNA